MLTLNSIRLAKRPGFRIWCWLVDGFQPKERWTWKRKTPKCGANTIRNSRASRRKAELFFNTIAFRTRSIHVYVHVITPHTPLRLHTTVQFTRTQPHNAHTHIRDWRYAISATRSTRRSRRTHFFWLIHRSKEWALNGKGGALTVDNFTGQFVFGDYQVLGDGLLNDLLFVCHGLLYVLLAKELKTAYWRRTRMWRWWCAADGKYLGRANRCDESWERDCAR